MRGIWLVPALAATLSCNGTTGFDLVTFYAGASGAADAVKGQPYSFDTSGYHVTLTRATLHVGALYLTQSTPTSGGGPAPCTPPGTYNGVFVGEVRGGGDVDLLDPSVQELSVTGDGSTIPAATGQVWLWHGGGDVNGTDPAPVLILQGSFDSAGQSHTFSAAMTIDTSRISAMANSNLPGEYQLCTFRIVSGIAVDLTLAQSGTLLLRVDPKALFNDVPLSDLPACPAGETATELCFTSDENNEPSRSLFENLTATGPYRFAWLSSAP